MKKSNVQRWGNSLGVRIPSEIAKKLSLHPGIIIEFKVRDGNIIMRPQQHSLATMVNQITAKNRHSAEWDENDLKGNEEW